MSKDGLAAVLHALATDTKGRPETARLRDVFADVETALAAGVPHASVLKALHDQGFKMSMASFRSALYRIRKERTNATPTRAKPAPATTTPAGNYPPPALPQETATPEAEDIPDADLAGMSQTERDRVKRERKAQRFISDKPANSLIKKIQEKQK